MNWRWIALAAFLGALAVGYGAWTHRGASPGLIVEPPSRPGYYLRGALITQTKPDGTLDTRLAAEHIELEPGSDDLSMSVVRLDYFQAANQEWRLTAERGFKPGNSDIIEFSGDVQLRPRQGKPEDVLRADALAVDPVKNLAYSTSSPVRIRFGSHAMVVERFEFDLSDERIRMQSIEGSYEQS